MQEGRRGELQEARAMGGEGQDAYSICARRSASRAFAICSSDLLAAFRSSFVFDQAQFKSLFFCHLASKANRAARSAAKKRWQLESRGKLGSV